VNVAVSAEHALHPLVRAAAEGDLPEWGQVSPERHAHMARVAGLLDAWATALGVTGPDRLRWRSLGYLHDCLKEAPEGDLRGWMDPSFTDLPAPVLHGPAAAARLAASGVDDRELLDAVRYHTLGHPTLGRMGRALYAADFLEPGRRLRDDWRRELRERMPWDADAVVREILRGRILHLVENVRPVRPETIAFWNALAGE